MTPKTGLFACLLCVAFLVLLLGAARHDSPTFDEPSQLFAGYSYWKTGNYQIYPDHPPLVRLLAAIPLLKMPLEFPGRPVPWQRVDNLWADGFFFRCAVPAPLIILAGRLVIILLALALGLVVFQWSLLVANERAALSALFFYILSPLILAHGHLITTDLGFGLFYCISLFLLWRWSEAPTTSKAAWAGLAFAAAFTSKFSGVVLCATIGLILFCLRKNIPTKRWIRDGLVFLGCAGLAILLVYRGQWMPLVAGLQQTRAKMGLGFTSFLNGHYSFQGWPYYFVEALLIKSPISFLLLAGVSIFHWARSPRRGFLLYWIYLPCAIYLAAASFSRFQIGLRHLLPVIPLLCIAVGDAADWLWTKGGLPRRCLMGLVVLGLGETLWAYPRFIPYFNGLVGGPSRGREYLADSNLDWGQELEALADYLQRQNVKSIYLSYFGTADPNIYGIFHKPVLSVGRIRWPETDYASLKREKKTLIAVSVSNLQGLDYPDHHEFGWLMSRPRLQTIGSAIDVYDITNDALAHRELARMQSKYGHKEDAAYEKRWEAELLSHRHPLRP